jgi:hypothetical protein
MVRSSPLVTLTAALAVCALAILVAAAAAHPCPLPVDQLAAGVDVAVERLLHGDLSGAAEALVAAVRG